MGSTFPVDRTPFPAAWLFSLVRRQIEGIASLVAESLLPADLSSRTPGAADNLLTAFL